MAPNTQHGKILFPEQLDPKENRFNNDYFDRGVWFIEDLVSNDRLNFCERYLHLANYEQMYDDIKEFFTTVKAPFAGLYDINTITGNTVMCYKVPKGAKKVMCVKVSEAERRTMCTKRRKRMVDYNGKDN